MTLGGHHAHDRYAAHRNIPDRTFPFLSAGQAARIRALAHRSFARAGHEVVIEPDSLIGADGRIWTLAELMSECAARGGVERDWSRAVARHVRRMIAVADQPPPESLPRQEVLTRVRLRIIRDGHIPVVQRHDFSYVRPVAPGFHRVLTLDSPLSITVLTDEFVYDFGLGELLTAAADNLRRVRFERVERLRGPRRERIYSLGGESVYTASKVLLLPEVVREVLRVEDHPYGVLAAVPHRNQLLVSLVEAATALAATRAMMQGAVDGFHHRPGAISPLVYWWRDGAFSQVSRRDGDGSYVVDRAAPFARVLAGFLHSR